MITIYDFEATNLHNPSPTQIGVIETDTSLNITRCESEYINPEDTISFPAMGITGITPEMVANAGTKDEVLPKFAPSPDSKYVASYNWSYDKQFVPQEFLIGKKHFCLLKLAKKLVDKVESGDHKLATLWYYFGCYKTSSFKGGAHDAKFDCLMTLDVLKAILETNDLTLDEAYDILYDITTCRYGKKYPNQKWEDIIKVDYDYIEYSLKTYEFEEDEKLYLQGLLSQYSGVKMEQAKVCTKGKHNGKPWEQVIKEDLSYVQWILSKGYIRGAELEWVKGLLEGG